MNNFQEAVAVVTGAGGGIGEAFSKRIAKQGCKLVICDMKPEAVDKVVEDIIKDGGEAIGRVIDVSDHEQMTSLADETYAKFKKCNLLFNNAGVLGPGLIRGVDKKTFDWVLQTNLGGVFNGVNAFLNRMLTQEEEGHILNTSSVSGIFGWAGLGSYSASKFGILGFSLSLASELKNTTINVSTLLPGGVETGITSAIRKDQSDFEKIDLSTLDLEEATAKAKDSTTIEPDQAVDVILDGLDSNEPIIFTHNGYLKELKEYTSRLIDAMERAPFK
tara:strand:- start:2742 stop:3566 length:825 start_codon:yes stop_codon:yes gene_type:complete